VLHDCPSTKQHGSVSACLPCRFTPNMRSLAL
jgi:hypothetical protein